MKHEEQEKQPELTVEEWGAKLTSAREEALLSIEQVATELNLPKSYINTLEQGGLEGLPSIVFARGYIRAYAKLLELDDDPLVAEYEQLHDEKSAKGSIRPVTKLRQQAKPNDPVMKFITWVFVLGIIGLSVWWWQAQDRGVAVTGSSQSEEAVAPVTTNGSSTLVLPKIEETSADEVASEQQGSDGTAKEEAEEPASEEPVYLSQDEVNRLQQQVDTDQPAETSAEPAPAPQPEETVTQAVPETPVPVVLDQARISADFTAECWVTIKDAQGKTLFNNLRGKGQSINVAGKPPLSVLIGAANAVGSFNFNGAPLDLEPHSSKNIIRISLPLAE